MITKESLTPGVKYSHDQVAHLFIDKKKDRIKRNAAKSFGEMTEDNRRVFLLLSNQIRAAFPDAVIYAGGSRVNGDWEESSDYDLNIYLPKEKWDEVKKMKFEYKADLHFKLPQGILIRQIV